MISRQAKKCIQGMFRWEAYFRGKGKEAVCRGVAFVVIGMVGVQSLRAKNSFSVYSVMVVIKLL